MYKRTHGSLYRHGHYKRQARGADLFMFSVATVAIVALIVTATGYSSSGTLPVIAAGNSTSANATQHNSAISAAAASPEVASTNLQHAHRIVCIGDSITEGFADPNNWPYHLKARLGGDWEVFDQGVGGATTGDMRDRINVALDVNPGFVVIMGGINDLAKGVALEVTERNIDTMCTLVESRGVIPILCTVTPTGDYLAQKDALNAWIIEYAHSKGYNVINYYATLNDMSHPGYADPTLVFDGTHPNQAGYAAMASTIDLQIFTGI